MRIIEATRRSGVAIAPDKTVRGAAQIMEQAGVGALAIIDAERVVGIVTDRDLVCRALSLGLPFDVRIDTVMTTPVVTVDADADLGEAVALFRAHKVRRLAVVRNRRARGKVQTCTASPLDASGRVDIQFTVRKGPFGANDIFAARVRRAYCRSARPLSRPTEADARLRFG
jgi:predicted transcriptional regulator